MSQESRSTTSNVDLAEDPGDPSGFQSIDKIDNEDGLAATEKGNLKWSGSYKGLKNFIMTQQISAENRTSRKVKIRGL